MNNQNVETQPNYNGCFGMIHKIQKGDTLYSLSRKYGVEISSVMAANPYVNVYNLQVGDEICVPKYRTVVVPQPREEETMIEDAAPAMNEELMLEGSQPMEFFDSEEEAVYVPMSETSADNVQVQPVREEQNDMVDQMPVFEGMEELRFPVDSVHMDDGYYHITGELPYEQTELPTELKEDEAYEDIDGSVYFHGNETVEEVLETIGITMDDFNRCMENLAMEIRQNDPNR